MMNITFKESGKYFYDRDIKILKKLFGEDLIVSNHKLIRVITDQDGSEYCFEINNHDINNEPEFVNHFNKYGMCDLLIKNGEDSTHELNNMSNIYPRKYKSEDGYEYSIQVIDSDYVYINCNYSASIISGVYAKNFAIRDECEIEQYLKVLNDDIYNFYKESGKDTTLEDIFLHFSKTHNLSVSISATIAPMEDNMVIYREYEPSNNTPIKEDIANVYIDNNTITYEFENIRIENISTKTNRYDVYEDGELLYTTRIKRDEKYRIIEKIGGDFKEIEIYKDDDKDSFFIIEKLKIYNGEIVYYAKLIDYSDLIYIYLENSNTDNESENQCTIGIECVNKNYTDYITSRTVYTINISAKELVNTLSNLK